VLLQTDDDPAPDVDLRSSVAPVAIVLLGRPGVTLEVVAHTLRTGGKDVTIDLASLEREPDQRIVAVIVRPTEADWHRATQLRADVVAVLDTDDVGEVTDVVTRGAEAVITTSSDPSTLVSAIDIVGAGGSVLEPQVARAVLQNLRKMAAERPALTLTGREMDILLSIERGDSIKQTARFLGISEKTVQNLQSRLFNKLQARNRAQAITRAHELGLLRTVWVT
jgi:DNA-binding NarL/FixJ family response regulator